MTASTVPLLWKQMNPYLCDCDVMRLTALRAARLKMPQTRPTNAEKRLVTCQQLQTRSRALGEQPWMRWQLMSAAKTPRCCDLRTPCRVFSISRHRSGDTCYIQGQILVLWINVPSHLIIILCTQEKKHIYIFQDFGGYFHKGLLVLSAPMRNIVLTVVFFLRFVL